MPRSKSAPLGSAKEQAKEVFKHAERLKYQDEDWQARDEALSRLQLLITAGALSTDGFVSGEAGFAANLKDLVHSLVAQLYDLRSVIVKSAVKTLSLLMTEMGDHADAERPLLGDALEGLLQLASSGNKVLSAAGREAFPHFIEMVRFESIINASPEGLLHWLRGMKHVPVKVCCLNSVLQALRTWPLKLLRPSSESLEVALIEAAANPAGEVRSVARQCLLQHLENCPERRGEVDRWLAKYPDTKKQLEKDKVQPGALSAEERVMPSIRQGEAGAKIRNGKLGGDGDGQGGDGSGEDGGASVHAMEAAGTTSKGGAMPSSAASASPGPARAGGTIASEKGSSAKKSGGGGGGGGPPPGLAERLASKQPPSLSGKANKARPLGLSVKEQAKEVFKHAERLKYQDEDWQARDEALSRLQLLITAGALSTDGFVSGEAGFAANLKDLVHSLVTQLFDLRSVVARSAAATLELLMMEVGDHESAEKPLREDALEGLLQLACSGNKVLAATGKEVFPKFIDAVRFESLLKEGLLHWLRGNKQVPVKVCCLNSVLQALRTWPLKLLRPSSESLEVALIEAAANPAGEVRSVARQCLLQHLENCPERRGEVDRWLAKYPDTKKQLEKDKVQPGALSAEERVMPSIRQGEAGAKIRNGKLGDDGDGQGGDGGAATEGSPANVSQDPAAAPPARKPLKKQGSMSMLASAITDGVKSALKGGTAAVKRTATRDRNRASSSNSAAAAGMPPTAVAQTGDGSEVTAGDGASGDPSAASPPQRSALERMKEAKELLDAGLLTQEEFDAKRAAIVSEI